MPKQDTARSGPFFQARNFQAVAALPAQVRRVVVLPVADDGKLLESSLNTLDSVVMEALTKTQRFECVPVSRDDFFQFAKSRAVRSVDVLPYDFFPKLAAHFGAEAVLFVDITNYSPYAPLTIGIRAKLARLDDRSLLWSIDQTFSAADPSVANSARRHWIETQVLGSPTDLSQTVLQTPSRFASYAFSASFATLPARKQ